MTKYLKIVACTAVVMAFASPASAKVINLYDLRNFLFAGSTCMGKACKGVETVGCSSAQGTYSSPPVGTVCEGVDKNNCYYNCYCPADKFPYAASKCSGNAFKAPTADNAKCTDSSGTYYASCSCADNYTDGSYIEGNRSYFEQYFSFSDAYTSTTDRSNRELKCYYLGAFACGGTKKTKYIDNDEIDSVSVGYEIGTAKITGEPIYYVIATPPGTVASDYESGTMDICTTGEWYPQNGSAIMTSDPTGKKKCAEFKSAKPRYSIGTAYEKQYYYYTGNCYDGTENCVKSPDNCVELGIEDFTLYNDSSHTYGNGACPYVKWIKAGWDDRRTYMCDSRNIGVPSGITHIPGVLGSQNYVRITGCASGYVLWDKGSVNSSAISEISNKETAAKNDANTEIVNTYTSMVGPTGEYSYIICRKLKEAPETITCPFPDSYSVYQCRSDTKMGMWLSCGRQNSQ